MLTDVSQSKSMKKKGKPKVGLTVAPFYPAKTINPYCSLLYGSIEKLGATVTSIPDFRLKELYKNRTCIDVLHFHWLHTYYRHRFTFFTFLKLVYFIIRIITVRLLGYRLVWTMHNIAPHDSQHRLSDSIAKFFMLRMAGIIVHCDHGMKQLAKTCRKKDAVVIPHGNYISVYPNRVSREEARSRLGIPSNSFVIASVGLVRGYKKLNVLIDSFNELSAENKVLVIAGQAFKFPGRALDELEDLAAHDSRIQLHLTKIPDEEIQIFFNAADYAAFSFDKILTSGSLMLAMSFGKAVIAPKLGCVNDLVDTRVGIFYDPMEEHGLQRALEKACQTDPTDYGKRALRIAKTRSWESIANRHLRFYGGDNPDINRLIQSTKARITPKQIRKIVAENVAAFQNDVLS